MNLRVVQMVAVMILMAILLIVGAAGCAASLWALVILV